MHIEIKKIKPESRDEIKMFIWSSWIYIVYTMYIFASH